MIFKYCIYFNSTFKNSFYITKQFIKLINNNTHLKSYIINILVILPQIRSIVTLEIILHLKQQCHNYCKVVFFNYYHIFCTVYYLGSSGNML